MKHWPIDRSYNTFQSPLCMLNRNVNTLICYVIHIAPFVIVSVGYKWVSYSDATTWHHRKTHTATAMVVGDMRTIVVWSHVARYFVESSAWNRNATGFWVGHKGELYTRYVVYMRDWRVNKGYEKRQQLPTINCPKRERARKIIGKSDALRL